MDCLSLYLHLSDVRLSEWSHRLNFQTMFLCFSYSLWILIGNYGLGFRVCLFFFFFFFCFFVGKQLDLLYIGQRIVFFFFGWTDAPCEFFKEWSSTCQFLKGAFLLTCQHLVKSFCFYILYMIVTIILCVRPWLIICHFHMDPSLFFHHLQSTTWTFVAKNVSFYVLL